ncbi:hypothetical protein GCM10017624_26160 [Azotobacter vinelandii]|nr:hypothetical protein GCM10017624_26160 [Azotobacter vinelandii]
MMMPPSLELPLMSKPDLQSKWTFLCRLQNGRLDFDLRGRAVPVSGVVMRLGLVAMFVLGGYAALGRIAG